MAGGALRLCRYHTYALRLTRLGRQNCIDILRYAAGPGRCGLVHALDLEYGLENQPTCVLYENYAVIVVADRIGAVAALGNGTSTQHLLDYAGRYIPLF